MDANRRPDRTPKPGTIHAWAQRPAPVRPEQMLGQMFAGLKGLEVLLAEPNSGSVLRCELALREIADQLRTLPHLLRGVPPEELAHLRASAATVHAQWQHVQSLFHRAVHFHAGWFRQFCARRGGYTRRGSPARVVCAQQFTVRG